MAMQRSNRIRRFIWNVEVNIIVHKLYTELYFKKQFYEKMWLTSDQIKNKMHSLYTSHKNDRAIHGKYLFDYADKLRAYELYFANN